MLVLNAYKRENAVVLIVRGRINFETVSVFKKVIRLLIEKGVFNLIIDLGSVTFIDSSGLGAILATKRMLNTAGGDIKIINLGRDIQQVFRLTEIDRLIEIYEDVQEAESQFSQKENIGNNAVEIINRQNKERGEMISVSLTKLFARADKLFVFNLSKEITTNNVSIVFSVRQNYLLIDSPLYRGKLIPVDIGDRLQVKFEKGNALYEFTGKVVKIKKGRIPILIVSVPPKIRMNYLEKFKSIPVRFPAEMEFCRIGQSVNKYVVKIVSLAGGSVQISFNEKFTDITGFIALRFYIEDTVLDSIVANITEVKEINGPDEKLITADFIAIKESERLLIIRYVNRQTLKYKNDENI